MTLLVELAVKASLLLGLALVGASWFTRRSAALTHLVLAAGMAGAASLPLVQVLAPAWSGPSLMRIAPGEPVAGPSEIENRSGGDIRVVSTRAEQTLSAPDRRVWSWSVAGVTLIAWGVGAVTALALLVLGLVRVSSIRRQARPVDDAGIIETAAALASEYGITRPVALVHSPIALLATWGWRRPVVFLPPDAAEWPASRLRIVLAHELAHVGRGDSALQTLAALVRAMFWFNPLAWVVARRLRDESERACDDLVIRTGIDPADYAGELLVLARHLPVSPSWMLAPAMARSCSLERRVTAMFDTSVSRQSPTRLFRTVLAAAFVLGTVAVGGYRATAQGFTTFSGQVRDVHGGHLAGVTLTLSNRVSGQKYEVKSDDQGVYEFVGVTPGDYDLQAARPGFKNYSATYAVTAGPARESLVLQVGTLQETITVTGGGSRDRVGPVSRRSQMAVVPAPQPCTVSAAGGQLKQPTKVKDVRPVYPPALAAASVGETMLFNATIATDGSVREVVPTKAENQELATAAMDAIRQWRFTPTLLNCEPVEVEMSVAVRFQPE